MASEWPTVSIAELVGKGAAHLQTGPFGSQLHKHDYVERGVKVIPTEAIGRGRIRRDVNVPQVGQSKTEELARHKLRVGDILFARRGIQATGLAARIDERDQGALCGTGAILLRVDESVVDSRFLAACISGDESYAWLRANSVGAVMPNLNTEIIGQLNIPVPPIREQRAIAETLGALDDRIDNLRQTNATLEAIAQALFKSWFVDFDGVPPEDMQESELGLIPKGWRVASLAELCELNTSKWTDKKHPPIVRYIDLSGVSSNRIESVNEFLFDDAPSRARMHLREGDTIVGTVRPGNRAFAYIHAPQANLTGSTGFAVLSPKQPHYASFIYLAATRDEAIKRLANLADGAAYPAVRPNVVAGTPCVIAPDEIIAEFSGVTKPLLERVEQNDQQAATLANIRDILLPRLISGRIRIGEAEGVTEGAAA